MLTYEDLLPVKDSKPVAAHWSIRVRTLRCCPYWCSDA